MAVDLSALRRLGVQSDSCGSGEMTGRRRSAEGRVICRHGGRGRVVTGNALSDLVSRETCCAGSLVTGLARFTWNLQRQSVPSRVAALPVKPTSADFLCPEGVSRGTLDLCAENHPILHLRRNRAAKRLGRRYC
ncbi:hypothetical protein GCM10009673_20230 [Nesterenkonia sandarakina]